MVDDNNIKYVDRNIKSDNPTIDELRIWIKKSKLPFRKVFNTSGLLYKEYNLKDKLDHMSDEEKLNMLASNGMLVKRPIIVLDDVVLFGFKIDQWETLLKR